MLTWPAMKFDVALKSLVGSGLIVFACSVDPPKGRRHADTGGTSGMVAAGGKIATGGTVGIGGDEMQGGGQMDDIGGESGSGMQMVPDAMADTPAPTLKAGFKTVTTKCDVEFDTTPTAAAGMKVYYVYAKGSFPGTSAEELTGVRILGTFTPEYAARQPVPVDGYQQYNIPQLIKDGEVMVMCGLRYESSSTPSYIYYSKVTMLLPTLTLG